MASFYDVLNVRGDDNWAECPDTFEETLEKHLKRTFEAVRIIVGSSLDLPQTLKRKEQAY